MITRTWKVGDSAWLLRHRDGKPYWWYVRIDSIFGAMCTVQRLVNLEQFVNCSLHELVPTPKYLSKESPMITRKTLKLFGCHEAAVEQFAREAGLEIEADEKRKFAPGDWVRVHMESRRQCGAGSVTDKSIEGWVGQVVGYEGHEIHKIVNVNFFGRPMPSCVAKRDGGGLVYECNLVPA